MMFKSILIMFFIILSPFSLGNMKPLGFECYSTFSDFPIKQFYNKNPKVRIKIIRKLRGSKKYDSNDTIENIAKIYSQEKNIKVRKELALTFVEYFKLDDYFGATDLPNVYVMGRGLSDKNSEIESIFVQAAREAFESRSKWVPELKRIEHELKTADPKLRKIANTLHYSKSSKFEKLKPESKERVYEIVGLEDRKLDLKLIRDDLKLYNPDLLNYLREFFRELSYEDAIYNHWLYFGTIRGPIINEGKLPSSHIKPTKKSEKQPPTTEYGGGIKPLY